jgi:dipeptidyl aminopeptidase/acylaminoacyl peptidase
MGPVRYKRIALLISLFALFMGGTTLWLRAEQSSRGPEPCPQPITDYGVLAYVQQGNVYIRELPDGKPQRIATQDQASKPRWSPSGKWLLFQLDMADKKERSFVVGRDGSGLREVCRDWQAAWVGPNDELAFEDGAIWLAHAPSFQRRQLARMPHKKRNDSITFLVSPDRKQIAFQRWWVNWNREGTEFSKGTGVLWVQNADGAHRRKLYDSHGSKEELPVIAGWSPDSRYVFMGTWVYHAGSGNLDGTPLYVFDTRTGRRKSLAPNLVMKHFDWYAYSPNKSLIVVMDGGERFGSNAKTLLVEEPGTMQPIETSWHKGIGN